VSILIRNCFLVDGTSEHTRRGLDVLLDGEHVSQIGRNLSLPEGVEQIDAQGKTLLPGLIDAHVHLTFDGSLDPVGHLTTETPYVTLLKGVRNASLNLQRGVTTVRDLGGPSEVTLALRGAVQQGTIRGPRILTSGNVITTTGGHCHFIGHEVDDPQDARRAARLEMKKGVDLVKVMATGGALTPGSSVDLTQFSVGEISAVTQEVHAHGLKVAAHANGLTGLRNAVEAGVDSIEHGSYADREVMEMMKDRGTWWVPTMTPARVLLEGPNSKLVPTGRIISASRNWEARRGAVIEGVKMGLRMAAGTDAGATLTEHGLLSLEVETFHSLGMPAMQAIWTATRWAAELLGIQDRVGSIAEGKVADLILVDGDPLEDLRKLRTPVLVIQGGRIVERREGA
jgi:imidazolonepropionase-like amidohydrolase